MAYCNNFIAIKIGSYVTAVKLHDPECVYVLTFSSGFMLGAVQPSLGSAKGFHGPLWNRSLSWQGPKFMQLAGSFLSYCIDDSLDSS